MESLDPANLRDMGKNWNLAAGSYAESLARFRKHGLAVYGTFVFGYDNDDRAVVRRSVDFAREQKLFLAAFNHLIPFPGTPLYRRLAGGRPAAVAALVARPGGPRRRRGVPAEESVARGIAGDVPGGAAAVLRLGIDLSRLLDARANCRSPLMAGVYLGLNVSAHFDIDLRQGLRLGAGLSEWEPADEPVSV